MTDWYVIDDRSWVYIITSSLKALKSKSSKTKLQSRDIIFPYTKRIVETLLLCACICIRPNA